MLGALVEQGYVAQAPGNADRRQRLLTPHPGRRGAGTPACSSASATASPAPTARQARPAVDGFRRVMRAIMDESARAYLDRADAPSGRPDAP